VTDWRIPINVAIAVVLVLACAFVIYLIGVWVVQEWAPRQPNRRLSEAWPGELADGGRMDREQREELLAGVSALENPAVIKSVERARRSGRLGRRGA